MDIAIVSIYFVGLILVGTRSFRIVKGVDGFFVADRAGSFLFICEK